MKRIKAEEEILALPLRRSSLWFFRPGRAFLPPNPDRGSEPDKPGAIAAGPLEITNAAG